MPRAVPPPPHPFSLSLAYNPQCYARVCLRPGVGWSLGTRPAGARISDDAAGPNPGGGSGGYSAACLQRTTAPPAGRHPRCYCCARGFLLRAVLLVPQPVAACGAAALCEEFCCAQCCLCFSPLPRAVLLPCSKSFAARGAACDSARCGAAVAREVFCCGRGCLFFSALLRAVPLLCARVLFAIKERAKRQAAPGAGVLFICTKAPVSDCH
jgi:hypothetical protein